MSNGDTINDSPRSMRDADVWMCRRAMLGEAHIAVLTKYAAQLRERRLGEVPDFDPLDGGVDARVLFLFEKPGRMTAEAGKRAGSGFISRNNDDGTAAAMFDFMRQAGIPRSRCSAQNRWHSSPHAIPRQLLGRACGNAGTRSHRTG